MNRTALVILLLVVAASGLVAALFATGFLNLSPRPSNPNQRTTTTTATNQLMINSTKPAIQSVTLPGCNPSTITVSNVQFPSNWYITVNASQTCSVVINLSYPSSYNVTFTGLSNGLAPFTAGTGQLTIQTSFNVTNVHLTNDSTTFNSPTNATLNIRNTGNATATLISYNVTDTSGNTWTRTSWNVPAVQANSMVPTNILIGSSCLYCTYNGAANAFNSFTIGSSYTVTIVISTNQPFKFPINR